MLEVSRLLDLDGDGDLDGVGRGAVAFNEFLPKGESGSRLQYAAGSPTSCEVLPVLGATGPFRVGQQLTIRVSGVVAGLPGWLTVGAAQSQEPDLPWPGIEALNWPWEATLTLPVAEGAGSATNDGLVVLEAAIEPSWPQFGDLFLQAFFPDPCSPSLLAASQGLRLRFD